MLAKNIKRYRTNLKLSQDQLARKADVSYATLIKLESGANSNPTLKILQQIATALDVGLDDLVKK